jgi:hypothetical protein
MQNVLYPSLLAICASVVYHRGSAKSSSAAADSACSCTVLGELIDRHQHLAQQHSRREAVISTAEERPLFISSDSNRCDVCLDVSWLPGGVAHEAPAEQPDTCSCVICSGGRQHAPACPHMPLPPCSWALQWTADSHHPADLHLGASVARQPVVGCPQSCTTGLCDMSDMADIVQGSYLCLCCCCCAGVCGRGRLQWARGSGGEVRQGGEPLLGMCSY